MFAGVAQLVERQPSKLNVVGSIPITRSLFSRKVFTVLEFIVDVATLGAAIFVGSVAFDWWRKRRM